MPLRMLSYVSFLVHKYEMNVYSTVFYLRPPAGQNDPGHYAYGDEVMGGLRFTYNVIRVYALEGEPIFGSGHCEFVAVYTFDETPRQGQHQKRGLSGVLKRQKRHCRQAHPGTLLYALSIFGGLIHPT